MGVARDKIVGWGVGQQRPHCGLRVRMSEGFQQRGTGTIIKVIDSGLAQPSVRVKWDGGKASTYFSGASVSRNAVSRPLHPEPAQMDIRDFIRSQGWSASSLATLTLGDLVEVDSDGNWVFDLDKLRLLAGQGASQKQMDDLRMFAIVALRAQNGLRLEPIKAGKLRLADMLHMEGEGVDATWKVDVEMMREMVSEATTDKLLLKQIAHLRAFASRTQQADPTAPPNQMRVSTAGPGHDLNWQGAGKGPGMGLPLVCATAKDVYAMTGSEKASYITGGRSKAVQLVSRGGRDLQRAYPFTASKLGGLGTK